MPRQYLLYSVKAQKQASPSLILFVPLSYFFPFFSFFLKSNSLFFSLSLFLSPIRSFYLLFSKFFVSCLCFINSFTVFFCLFFSVRGCVSVSYSISICLSFSVTLLPSLLFQLFLLTFPEILKKTKTRVQQKRHWNFKFSKHIYLNLLYFKTSVIWHKRVQKFIFYFKNDFLNKL